MLWQDANTNVESPTGVGMVNLEHVRTGGGGGNGVPVWDTGEAHDGRKWRRKMGNKQRFREGGSASRTSEDQSSIDPGGGGGSLPIKERVPPWQTPEDDGGSSRGKVDDREFPVWGTQRTARKVTGPADPVDTERDRRPSGHPIPVSRGLDRGMRLAGNIRSVRKGNRDVRAQGVPGTPNVTPFALGRQL